MDPTWTYTCPCGAEVDVNLLGQHHHRDCEYSPLHPGCCDDSSLRRLFSAHPNAGVECKSCGQLWRGSQDAYLKALANNLTEVGDSFRNGPERAAVYRSNLAILHRVPCDLAGVKEVGEDDG